MTLNNPIFADLSSYSPKDSITFYERVFDWSYYKEYDYYTAYQGNDQIVGLYETPIKFKQMRMPSFWMTYFKVESVEQTVDKASAMGGIIEMTDEIPGYGKVALIRDPQGSGFTVYEGDILSNTRTQNTVNTLIWNELHISDPSKILPFYQAIFNWEIIEQSEDTLNVLNGNKEHICDIMIIPNDLKGKFEYWICTFKVDDLQASKKIILKNGGSLIIDEGHRILFTDNSGEAFFYAT